MNNYTKWTMTRSSHTDFLRFLSISAISALLCFLNAGVVKGDEHCEIPIKNSWTSVVKDHWIFERCVGDQATWEKCWQATSPMKKVPKVDFDTSLVLVHIQDAADPNRKTLMVYMDDAGFVEACVKTTTLLYFEPSNRKRVTFIVIERIIVRRVRHTLVPPVEFVSVTPHGSIDL